VKAFDPQGNFSLGLTEQSVFPELTFEDIAQLHGLQINFVIKNGTPENSRALLESFGRFHLKKPSRRRISNG
jgi:large subunit ribosomal protein L5